MSEREVECGVDHGSNTFQVQGLQSTETSELPLGVVSTIPYEDCKDTQVVPEVPEPQGEATSGLNVKVAAALNQRAYHSRSSSEDLSSSSGECTSGTAERSKQDVSSRSTPTASDEQHDTPVKLETSDDPKTEPSDNHTKTTDSDKPSQTEFTPKERSKPKLPRPETVENCPRCGSVDTKFCYYNNYNIKQPRFFCKACQRYWTAGGTLRDVPVGAGRRKSKSSCSKDQDSHALPEPAKPASNFPVPGGGPSPLAYPNALQQVLTDPSLAYSAVTGTSQQLPTALTGLKIPGVLQLPPANWQTAFASDYSNNIRPAAPPVNGNPQGQPSPYEARLLSPNTSLLENQTGNPQMQGTNSALTEDGSVDGRRLRFKSSSPDPSLGALGLAALANPSTLSSLVQSADRELANGGNKELNKSLLTGALMDSQLATRANWLQQAHNWPLLHNQATAMTPNCSAPLDLNASILPQTSSDWLNIAAATANKQQQVTAAQVAAAVAAQAAAAANQNPVQAQAAAQAAQAAAYQVQAAQAAVAQAAAAQAAGWPPNQVGPYWSLWGYNNYANAAAANYMAAAAAAAYGGAARLGAPGHGWNPLTEAAAAATANPSPPTLNSGSNSCNIPGPGAAAAANALAANALAAQAAMQGLQNPNGGLLGAPATSMTPQGLSPWAPQAAPASSAALNWAGAVMGDSGSNPGASVNMPWGNWIPPMGMTGTQPSAVAAAAALNPALNQFAGLHPHLPNLGNLTAALKAGNSPSHMNNGNSLSLGAPNGSGNSSGTGVHNVFDRVPTLGLQ